MQTLEQPALPFGGETFDPDQDGARLGRQLRLVLLHMLRTSPEWQSLEDISRGTGGEPHASVSARIRDLKKGWAGSYPIEKKRLAPGSGTWLYRIDPEFLK
jgi:hypothetical protein